MTEWSDAEISRRLALAIGYLPEDVKVLGQNIAAVWRSHSQIGFACEGWYVFSYTSPAVIWPIAERFDCFPNRWDESGPKQWVALGPGMVKCVYADTAAKAVALAVIKAKEQT